MQSLQTRFVNSHHAAVDSHEAECINVDGIASWALPPLAGLIRSGIPLEIIPDDQDFTDEWLRSGHVVGCVVTGQQPLNGCKITPLGAMRYVVVDHPDMIAECLPDGLTQHNFRVVPFVASTAGTTFKASSLTDASVSNRFP